MPLFNIEYKKILNHVFLIRDFLLVLIFPISCLACKQGEAYLCDTCKNKIIINKKFSCPNCKKNNNLGEYCKSCQTNHKLDGLWISSDYHNKILTIIIKKFKYSFNQELALVLSDLVISFIKENKIIKKSNIFKNLNNLIIIPVPLHKNKKRFRGFNQSELLAEIIAKKIGSPLNTTKLTRHKDTKPQAKLNRKQRLINVDNAFKWTGQTLKNKNIILIDDVTSTGATLNNCAKTLKSNKAQNVWGLVLAKN
jgi:ComF family protein